MSMIYDPYIKPKRDPFSPYYGYRKRREREKKFLRRIIILIFFAVFLFILLKFIHKPTYGIFINGNLKACVKGKGDILKILKKIENEKVKGYKHFRYRDKIEIKKIKKGKCQILDLDEVEKTLKKEVIIQVKTSVLKINGKDVLAADKKDIEDVLDSLKEKYSEFHQKSLGKINFKEKIEIYERYVNSENVKNKNEIMKILSGLKSVNYVIKKGDLGNTIAKKFGTNISVLKLKNPQVNFDSLKIGETIKIKDAPLLTVVTQKLLIKKEKIPAPVIYISTTRLAKGQQEIRQKGQDGEKEKVILLTYENGKLATQELLKEKISKKPTICVIVKGIR